MVSVIDSYRGSQDMGWVGNLRRVANPPAEAAKRAVKRRLPTGAQDAILPYNCAECHYLLRDQ